MISVTEMVRVNNTSHLECWQILPRFIYGSAMSQRVWQEEHQFVHASATDDTFN